MSPLLVAARPDAEAALGRGGEAAVVVREGELGLDPARCGSPVHPQVRVERVGVDDLAGVHPCPSGSQIALNSRNACDQLGAEHLRQQLRPRLTIAVLAGERAAVGGDQVAGVLHERAVVADALGA